MQELNAGFIERETTHVRRRIFESDSAGERLYWIRTLLDARVPFPNAYGKYQRRRSKFDNRKREPWELKQKCLVCKAQGKRTHIHHLIPVAKGGNDTRDNLVRVCYDCHCKIHGRDLDTQTPLITETVETPKPTAIFGTPGVVSVSLADL